MDRRKLSIENIAAKKLNDFYEITVTDGEGNTFTLNYSALSYANKGIHSSKTSLQNLSRSLYLYNQKAIAYFNQNQN